MRPPLFISARDNSFSPNPAYFDWKRIDAMMLSWIQATVSLDVLRALLQPGASLTVCEPCFKIDSLFRSQTQSQEVYYRREFVNFKKGNHSIFDYVNHLKILADNLLSLKVPITEKDLMTQLCTGLPQDYIPISTNITSRVPLPSFIEARSMLLLFEAQLKSFGPVSASLDHSSPAAFFAPRHFQSNGNRVFLAVVESTISLASPKLVSKALYVEASPGSTMASPSTSTPHFDTGETSHMTPNYGDGSLSNIVSQALMIAVPVGLATILDDLIHLIPGVLLACLSCLD
ncbi:hypothetical protein LIER_30415 [Lithospermum erythrorhizon]|uniref:Uncharacterized protein n=1 Tax=Lithospermum erythrorhizon TaxID=34254 RepID=A0AAV3RPF4_LITER